MLKKALSWIIARSPRLRQTDVMCRIFGHDYKLKRKIIHRVTRSNLFKGMCVQDSEGKKGVIRNCKDLHNVHVTFEGEGIEIDWYGTPFECGGSGLYCFVEDCKDNCENEDPLYYCG